MARFNFEGWNIKTWAIKNKDSIKLIVSGVVGILTVFTANLGAPWNATLGGVVGILSKLVLDTLDYWQSK